MMEDGYIKYKNKTIAVIIDNNDIVWFNGKETCDALKQHTKKYDRTYLRDINAEEKIKSNYFFVDYQAIF